MATIPRFIKNTVPNLIGCKFLIYDLPLHSRVFGPHDRRLYSKVSEHGDEEVLSDANPELFARRPKSKKLNADYSYSSEISPKKCSDILPFSSKKEPDKYKYFSSYTLAKKLGDVESLEDFVSQRKNYIIVKDKNNLVNVPLGCKHFNNGRFPNERSMHNWIKAVDLGLQEKWITSFGLSMALSSFAKLLNEYPGPDQNGLLSVVGCDRITTWFQIALSDPSVHSISIKNCIHAARYIAAPAAFNKWNLDSVYGRLNYSLSTYISAQLIDVEILKDDEIFFEILLPIIEVEINLDQPCSLDQETKDKVVDLAIQFFHYCVQLMEKAKSPSLHSKGSISLLHCPIALLFCHWSVNVSQFWYDWFEFSLNTLSEANENPFFVSKQLHSLLLVLLKLNANPNFLPIDTDLAKYLAEKVKPVLIEKLLANGLKFLVKRQQGILLKLAMGGLHASKSALFTNEELKEIIGILDPRRYIL